MNVIEVLNLDYRTEEGREGIQRKLHSIPAISKRCFEGTEVPLEFIERLINQISRNHMIMVINIIPSCLDNGITTYCTRIKDTYKTTYTWNVYGCSIYEVMAKTAIQMYYLVKLGKLQPMDEESWRGKKRV